MSIVFSDYVKENGVDYVLEEIMQSYIENGSFAIMNKKFNRTNAKMGGFIAKHKERCEVAHGYTLKRYKMAVVHAQRFGNFVTKTKKTTLEDILEQYGEVVKYDVLLNDVFNCNTGVMTGNDIIKEANKKGIRVVDNNLKVIKI